MVSITDMRIGPRHLSPFFLLRALRSLYFSRTVTERVGAVPIRIGAPFLKVKIKRDPTASFVLRGILSVHSFQDGNESVSIRLGRRSNLIIDGDFSIGNGTRIWLDEGASLYIGGKKDVCITERTGITERSRIMVRKNVHIGADCIIAWNVFITDCDWHKIEGKSFQEDVFIGEHVWIAANTTILKGSKIGNGCIVGANSLVHGITLPDNCLAAGNPIKILEENVRWRQAIPQNYQQLSRLALTDK